MTCKDFLQRYSEYRDAPEGDPVRGLLQAHLEECSSCRRYEDVLQTGVEELRSTSSVGLREDFRDRLRHRIYQSDWEERQRRNLVTSTVLTVGAAAGFFLAWLVIWGPVAVVTPNVDLPGIQARAPGAFVSGPPASSFESRPTAGRAPGFLFQEDLWSQSHHLLYEISPLYHRTREGALVRAGLH